MEYFFSLERSPNHDTFAEYDQVGNALCVYLPEFKEEFPYLKPAGKVNDDLLASLIVAIFVHEDLHKEVEDCVDTTGGQQHETYYEWIKEFLDKDDD